MSENRMRQLLNDIINYTSIGRNKSETINELLNMGFTGEELEEFGFNLLDISDVMDDRDDV